MNHDEDGNKKKRKPFTYTANPNRFTVHDLKIKPDIFKFREWTIHAHDTLTQIREMKHQYSIYHNVIKLMKKNGGGESER
jgi:hypothetical protein